MFATEKELSQPIVSPMIDNRARFVFMGINEPSKRLEMYSFAGFDQRNFPNAIGDGSEEKADGSIAKVASNTTK